MNSHEGDVDIFSLSAPETPFGKFFYHKEVGDLVKGTYIDVREGKDTFGNDQRIFVLRDADGEVWNVGVRLTSTFLLEAMKAKRFGDIIGFRLDELRANKKNPGYKPTKIINVYPKNIQGPVDTVWLAEQEALKAQGYVHPSHTPSKPVVQQPASSSPALKTVTVDPIFDQVSPVTQAIPQEQPKPVSSVNSEGNVAIRNLAKTKGLVTDDMSTELADNLISTFTGLPLTDENFGQIIIKLSGYTK